MKVNKKIIILFLSIFLGAFSVNAHPFYISLCQIDYNQENQSVEISVKIFVDDLINAMAAEGHDKLYIGEEREDKNTDAYIFAYLQDKLHLKVNEQSLQFNFVGKELDKDVVWSYLEIPNVKSLNDVEVSCNILVDMYSDQSNVVQVNKNGDIINLLLNKRKTQGSIDFSANK